MKESKPYSLEQAQKEAEKLQQKVESGKASSYSDAERLVELEHEQNDSIQEREDSTSERKELAPILVTVEQLIPDIKPKEMTESTSTPAGRSWDDIYADRLPKYFDSIFGFYGLGENRLLKDGLRGQIVIDLGAGNRYGYVAALGAGARGYVAIDKYYDLSWAYSDPEEVRNFVDETWPIFCRSKELIPVAVEQEDMLSFLRRLPDNSVSIISSGHCYLFGGNPQYTKELKKEMLRVLSPSGLLIVNDGISPDNDLVNEVLEYGTIRVIVKKDETRSKKVGEEDEAFRAVIAREKDIKKLQAIKDQLEHENVTDYYRISIVTDRIRQLENEQGSI